MSQKIIDCIVRVLREDGEFIPEERYPALFRDPSTWAGKFGDKSSLIVVHDGGPLAPYFNWDYCLYASLERMRVALSEIGYYPEQCTSWYSGVYATEVGERKCEVWIALGRSEDEITKYSFDTEKELNAFLLGVDEYGGFVGLRQLNTQKEVDEYLGDRASK